MKDSEFRSRIQEFAEIEDHKVAQVNIRSKKQEEEGNIFPPGENPTLGFAIKRMKPNSRLCELGCGEVVNNQVIEIKKHHSPVTHWRTKCVNCNCVLSPDGTGLIDATNGSSLQNAFIRHYKGINTELVKTINSSDQSGT